MNLYVHFPFCRAKCAYCALLSRVGASAVARADHVARIVRDLPNGPLETVYFGGGTPALCDLAPVFEALSPRIDPAGGTEFTVELHPLDVKSSALESLRRGGVNRISLGVQSFDDGVLNAMGRGHTAVEAERAFREVKTVFPNAGMDLIAGWPGCSDGSWRETLMRALALEPVHMSCYSLIHEPKTRLDLAVRKGALTLPDDDAALAQVSMAREAFAAAGLARYEVSNYARPGFECRHNCAVWRGEDYVGLGEGAHGRVGFARTIGMATGYSTEAVTPEEDAFERAVLGLRTAFGIDLADIANRHPLLAERLPAWRRSLEALVAPGILRKASSDRFVPTDRGFEVCDAVMAEL
ncbi:MAG: coproporphyrinogen-III oxidase family protein [bacterium]|nr:coproporphyrinogen-III oxidase family protein [bacterium]